MLTNFKTIKQSLKRLKEMEAMCEDGSLDKLGKKEALMTAARIRQVAKVDWRDQGDE
jgi:small subunit ribosomal protein S2